MNLGVLISYIFLGLTLAAPIGPVNSARLDKGIKNGFWHAWSVGAGSLIADGCFMLLVYLGFVEFLGISLIQVFLWLFGAFVLIYTGIESIVKVKNINLNHTRGKEPIHRCFFIGFFMSITSPLSILFWIGIYGSVLAKTAATYGSEALILYSSMIFLGLTIWDIFIAALTSGFRSFLNVRTLKIISVVSGTSLIVFGLYFGVQGMKVLAGWT